jgi:hypothetical protein
MRQPEKSCPFCGDIDRVIVIKCKDGWHVICLNFEECFVDVKAYGKTRDEAIDNWEKRSE